MIRAAALVAVAALLPSPLWAQDLGGALGAGLGDNAVMLVLVLTALSLAPGIAIMVTAFPFIVTVLSILRQSIGLQQSPPNMLIVSLAIFLTWFIMDPVLREAWTVAGLPLQQGQIGIAEAFQRGIVPFEGFMAARTDPDTLANLAEIAPGTGPADRLSVLIPSFMLSEIQRAFEIGFLIALPFLIIDLVVAAVLMSMGMMMLPPVVVSLPFKLAFFVVVDGWGMIAGGAPRGQRLDAHHGKDLVLDMLGVQAAAVIHRPRRVVVDERIRQDHRPEAQPLVEGALLGQQMGDMAAETAHGALLDGDQRLVIAGQGQDQIAVQRLGKTRVGDRGRDAPRHQRFARGHHLGQARAEGQDGDALALRDHAALADGQDLPGKRKAMGPLSCAAAVATM